MSAITIAACQLSVGTDVRSNLRQALDAIELAASRGASLVVLPEATICPPPGAFASHDAAQPLDGWFVEAVRESAARLRVVVVVGTFTPGPDDRVYNTVVAVGDDGEIVGTYDKIHLFDAFGVHESAEIEAGPRPDASSPTLTIEHRGAVLGVATCYDLRFPELFRAHLARGVDAYLVPAAWLPGPEKERHWTTLLRSRAIENSAYVVAADQCAPHGIGRSQIIDPMGRDVATSEDAPGIVMGTLDTGLVTDTRRLVPSISNRRFDVRLRGSHISAQKE
jgi:predicted amidohydrolase